MDPTNRPESLDLARAEVGQAVLDLLPGVACLFTADLGIARCNEAFERASGCSAEELAARRAPDLFAADDRATVVAWLARVLAGASDALQVSIASTAGASTPYLISGKRIVVGGAPCVLAVGADVTDRVGDAEAVRRSEEKLRWTLERSPLSMAIVRMDGTIEYINRRAVETFGYPHEDIPTMERWFALAYPDPAYRAHVLVGWMGRVERAIVSGEEIERWEYEVTCKDGTVKTTVIFGVIVADTVFVMFDDITERKRAEESALREREHNFSSLSENSSHAILVVLASGAACYANRQAVEVTGYEVGELLAIDLDRLASPGDAVDFAEAARAALSGGADPSPIEARLVTKRGAVVPVEVTAAPTTWTGERAALVVFRDISERKQLEARVAQADRLASMGTLAAGVAHEINNPLAYILDNARILAAETPRLAAAVERCSAALRDRVGAEEHAAILGDAAELLTPASLAELSERAAEALDGTLRIRGISRTLGNFSRGDREELGEVDPRAALESALKMVGNEIRHRAELVRRLDPVPAVTASAGKLSQVFLNLLINAVQAIDEGHAADNRIDVRTWSEGAEVFVAIGDTGQGIPKESLERIFDPFFTTKGPGKGSGLGLSICRTIVGELGGDLRVESAIGQGTTVVVRLPARVAVSVAVASAVPAAVGAPAVVRRGRILVVDDEAALRRNLQRQLGRAHDVVTVGSGEEARRLLETDTAFDLILCDVMMPHLSGPELHAWLVARDPAVADRMVFMTGGAFTSHATEYLASLGNVQLEKPFDSALLRAIAADRVAGRAASG